MYISEKIFTLLAYEPLIDALEFINRSPCTITILGSRAIQHEGYYGNMSLYWMVDILALFKERSLEDVASWQRIKNSLVTKYEITSSMLETEVDIVNWLFNCFREFNYSEFRSPNQKDFEAHVSESLDTPRFRNRIANMSMINDFWEGYHTHRKKRLIHRNHRKGLRDTS